MNIKKFTRWLMVTLFAFCVLFIFIFYFVLYPIKYKKNILASSAKYDLSASLICAVINTESSFNKMAKSSAGAIGLMQLLPSTAKWIAEKNNYDFKDELLYDPKTNIEFGCYYLSYLIQKFEVSDVAICAYNAGEGTVRTWLASEKYSSDGKTLEVIPYKETKDYLQRIKYNISIYYSRF